jgi:hypothetical protein
MREEFVRAVTSVSTRPMRALYVLVTDDSGRLILRKPRPWHRLLARLRASKLDKALARGADPESCVYLAVRARQLLSARLRHRLAAGLRRLVDGTAWRADAWEVSTWEVTLWEVSVWQVETRQVRAARISQVAADLAALADRLEMPGPVPVRGVALARQLRTEGSGPMYQDLGPNALRGAVLEALSALADGH